MRKTLHEYVIEQFNKYYGDPNIDLGLFAVMVNKFAKLTNRAPRLGDFIPCDEDGNVLEEPQLIDVSNGFDVVDVMWDEEAVNQYQEAQKRIIFKGDWEVVKGSNEQLTRIHSKSLSITIDFEPNRISLIRTDKNNFVLERSSPTRIEDLPRNVEFKNDVI